MFRNMVTSLFKHERIRTTDAKAKELRRWADQLVTLAKRGDLHARRQAMAIIREKDVVHKLFAEAPKRFADVNGGYTRVVKMGVRPGDAAPISLVELVTPEPKKKKKPRRRKKSASAAKAAPAVKKQAAVKETDSAPEAEATPGSAETEATAEAKAPDPVDAPAEEKAEAKSEDAPAQEAVPEPPPKEAEADEKKEEK